MVNRRHIIYIIMPLVLLLAGCIHDYPTLTPDGEDGVDPTLVEVTANVTLDLNFVPLDIDVWNPRGSRSGTSAEAAPESYRRRFIIEAWREGKPEARQVTVVDDAPSGDNGLTIPLRIKLHAVEYTLVVWTDYVVEGTDTDLYYDSADLQYIACTTPYTGSTPYRDCLYGTASLDLRQYRDSWNVKVPVKVEMVRPLAKYEIIATDVRDFLRKMKKQRAADEEFTITFSYGFYFPTVFNALSGKPVDSWTGVRFTTPLIIPEGVTDEYCIGSDFVFVNGTESFVKLTMEIHDSHGELVSRTSELEVPYRRGHFTTMRARFLTNEMQGGVEIDPDYDGDIDIDLDEWMN